MLPVPSDLQALLRRLAIAERDRVREAASLEARIRRFEDVERPAYECWRRLTFGPSLSALQERYDEVQARRALARRVMELVERDDRHPREALYLATHRDAGPVPGSAGPDPDEVEARRRAKRERKRADRRRTARAARASEAAPRRIVTLYRALARRLHPDSHTAIRSLDPTRVRAVWNEVQAAYEARSLERMLAISAWLERASEPDAVEPPAAPLLSLAERHERLRALGRSCRALERRLAELERDPAWNFLDAPPEGPAAPGTGRRPRHRRRARATASGTRRSGRLLRVDRPAPPATRRTPALTNHAGARGSVDPRGRAPASDRHPLAPCREDFCYGGRPRGVPTGPAHLRPRSD